MTTQSGIDSVLKEARVFNPPAEFQASAHVASIADYERLYQEADVDPESFWGKIAEDLHWFRRWDKVLEWEVPFAKWFVGARTNISYNCLDRHVASWRRNKAALIWEGEPGEVQTLTFQQLLIEV
ncbi:MAG: acetyl-coenzyme A synthetase N-terminal domain-containing protein [Bryobacteraceae bacterium]